MRTAPLLLLAACHAAPSGSPGTDRATVLTAAGVEQPRGLDWPDETAAQPSRKTFRNVHALAGVSSERFMAAMQSMRRNVGLECLDCHLREDYSSDAKKPKIRARQMLQMTARINLDLFGGNPVVTCFTCHLGRRLPPQPAFAAARAAELSPTPLAAAEAERPATEVYRNVQVFDDVKAGELLPIMSWFTQQLGVSCTHCHEDGGRWESDGKRAKRRARQMLLMVGNVARLHYKGSTPVTCGTCHRGEVRPARTPADLAAGQN
jgi:Photosynthetic reaction centre cytochrome C subunit